MKRILLAAAALALGSSAFAMDDSNVATGKGHVIGLLYQASQQCGPSYDSQGMANLANAIFLSLQRQRLFSDEEIARQVGFGAGVFIETVRERGIKAACDSVGPAYANARAAYDRYH